MVDMKKLIRKMAEKIFQSSWYPNKKILLESVPDMSCQTYPVFQHMLKEHLNDEYKLIWLVNDKSEFKDVHIKNVQFVNYATKSKWECFKRLYLIWTSRVILYAKRYIGKISPNQLYVYLMHGACIKSKLKHEHENAVNESDACITLSPFLLEYDIVEEHIPRENFIITGYPRNDFLFLEEDYTKKVFPNTSYDKLILWMPTFRKTSDGRVDSQFDMPLGIPCLYSEEDCIKVNEALEKQNILLVLKPHPGQDVSLIKSIDLSNFVIIYDKDLKEKGVQLYQFVGSTDALITDYSSIYYDYLLTQKKIGITTDDFDAYSEDTGFVFENVFDILVGKYMNNSDEFVEFIQYVASDEDDLVEERNRVSRLVHAHHDNKSTERVYNYIIDELHRRYK